MQSATTPSPDTQRARVYRFDRYMLDLSRRTLSCDTTMQRLPEKLFRILVLLLEANCRTVEKSTFFERVWANEGVSDGTLSQHIFMLRGLLGERAGENSYIVTVPGRGYRFAVAIEAKFGLAMKGSCERCGCSLGSDREAYICSYECTFCAFCSAALSGTCPNCGGELVVRPRRSR